MGCVCSKGTPRRNRSRTISADKAPGSGPTHLVSLTSSTYGLLQVGSPQKSEGKEIAEMKEKKKGVETHEGSTSGWIEKKVIGEAEEPVATINAWELMAGLEDESPPKKNLCQRKGIDGDLQKNISQRKEIDDDLQGKKYCGKENLTPKNRNRSVLKESGRAPFAAKNLPSENTFGTVSRRVSFPELNTPSKRLDSRLRLSLDFIKEPSSPLFDPNLLASFEKAIERLSEDEWNAIKNADSPNLEAFMQRKGTMNPTNPSTDTNPLDSFEEKCPPRGSNAVVLYTTTLRGIRKTFEDCNSVRDALEGYGVFISERDVSMHLEFRNELRKLMGKLVTVPRVFIKGRYIGGADEVLKMHEEGSLAELLVGIPAGMAGRTCDGCGGVHFVPCLDCNGSCKLFSHSSTDPIRCPQCNENGLIQCPICC